MNFEELKEEILERIGLNNDSESVITALEDIMGNDLYVNWWDILDTLKTHLSREELAEMFDENYID